MMEEGANNVPVAVVTPVPRFALRAPFRCGHTVRTLVVGVATVVAFDTLMRPSVPSPVRPHQYIRGWLSFLFLFVYLSPHYSMY